MPAARMGERAEVTGSSFCTFTSTLSDGLPVSAWTFSVECCPEPLPVLDFVRSLNGRFIIPAPGADVRCVAREFHGPGRFVWSRVLSFCGFSLGSLGCGPTGRVAVVNVAGPLHSPPWGSRVAR